jgi:hypothetical protein
MFGVQKFRPALSALLKALASVEVTVAISKTRSSSNAAPVVIG